MFEGLSFLGEQVEVLYQRYRGQFGRIRGLDAYGLWIVELDEGDQYGPVVLALESRSFRFFRKSA